jgi:hypothetical protein
MTERTVWLYVDESGTPTPDSSAGGTFRVGVLAVESPITADLTTAAMESLAADPDAVGDHLDRSTLGRGYFHARADSKNAHAHLCIAVRERIKVAEFVDMQWRFEKDLMREYQERLLHHLINRLATMRFSQRLYDSVHLIVAARERTFDRNRSRPPVGGSFRSVTPVGQRDDRVVIENLIYLRRWTRRTGSLSSRRRSLPRTRRLLLFANRSPH